MRVVLDSEDAALGIRRVAGQIVERAGGARELALVGIRRGGVPIAERLASLVEELEGVRVPVGSVDISLYRDDASTALPNPRIGRSDIPFAVEGRRIVLVDDVLFTGRTIRAALDALLDYGRPRKIELAVLVDRGGRELPIQPDYCVRAVDVANGERVDVLADASGFRAVAHPSTEAEQ
jgi:pyrimidine operon attenuation protein/uracil phosphoribosyltransferase